MIYKGPKNYISNLYITGRSWIKLLMSLAAWLKCMGLPRVFVSDIGSITYGYGIMAIRLHQANSS